MAPQLAVAIPIIAGIATAAAGITGLIKNLMEMAAMAEAAADKLQESFLKPGPALDTLSDKVLSLAGVDFDKLAGTAINVSNSMHDLSLKSGVAAADLSVLAAVADTQNVSIETLGSGFSSLNGAIDGALDSNEQAREAFGRLGVSVEELKTKSPRDIFLDMANGLASIQDPATRAALAQQILGQSADDLLPTMLSLAGDGFKKATAEADALGRIISGPAAASADRFEQNLAKLKGTLVGNAQTLMGAVLPAVNMIAELFLDTGQNRVPLLTLPLKILTGVVHGLANAFVTVIGTAGALFNYLEKFFSGIDDWIKNVFTGKGGGGFGAALSAQWAKDMKELDDLKKKYAGDVGKPESANREDRYTPPPPPPTGGTNTQTLINNYQQISNLVNQQFEAQSKTAVAAERTASAVKQTVEPAEKTVKAAAEE